jgi:hypothetical protein
MAAILLAWPALAADTPMHSIAVEGQAEVKVMPDYATIDIGVVSQNAIVADALSDNGAKMSRVIAAIRVLGIPEADIQTSDFAITPKYQKRAPGEGYDSDDMRPIVGYSIMNSVKVTVSDLAKVAKIIDATVQVGANASSSVEFAVRDPARYLDQVRAAAVDAAHHKAEVFTAAAHLKLGRALSVTDNRANASYNDRPGTDRAGIEMVVVTAQKTTTPILSGEIAISAEVTVVYATD